MAFSNANTLHWVSMTWLILIVYSLALALVESTLFLPSSLFPPRHRKASSQDRNRRSSQRGAVPPDVAISPLGNILAVCGLLVVIVAITLFFTGLPRVSITFPKLNEDRELVPQAGVPGPLTPLEPVVGSWGDDDRRGGIIQKIQRAVLKTPERRIRVEDILRIEEQSSPESIHSSPYSEVRHVQRTTFSSVDAVLARPKVFFAPPPLNTIPLPLELVGWKWRMTLSEPVPPPHCRLHHQFHLGQHSPASLPLANDGSVDGALFPCARSNGVTPENM